MNVRRANPDHTDWVAVRALLRHAFSYMEARLGHAPAVMKLSASDLQAEAEAGTVFLAVDESRLAGCLFCRASRDHGDAFYLGKLAVSDAWRGAGVARQLVEAAADEARRKGYARLTLDTGAALTELHEAFGRLGFGLPVPRTDEPEVVTMFRNLDVEE